MTTKQTTINIESLKSRARELGLWGLLAHWDEVSTQPWLSELLSREEDARARRSLERRMRLAHLGSFKLFADFDWKWPRKIDQLQIQELFSLCFLQEQANVIIVGQNGVGKTMLAKNLAYQAILQGHSALFVTVSELLNDLAAQESGSALERRLRHYCRYQVLVIDELGYLATSSEHADLLFEVVTRRYQKKPIVITSNRSFTEWGEVFPTASCVVAMVDRLIHKSEVININADSYRKKEAEQRLRAQKNKRSQARKRSNTK